MESGHPPSRPSPDLTRILERLDELESENRQLRERLERLESVQVTMRRALAMWIKALG